MQWIKKPTTRCNCHHLERNAGEFFRKKRIFFLKMIAANRAIITGSKSYLSKRKAIKSKVDWNTVQQTLKIIQYFLQADAFWSAVNEYKSEESKSEL